MRFYCLKTQSEVLLYSLHGLFGDGIGSFASVLQYGRGLGRQIQELVYGIYEPYCKLPADERRILALRYWQKMEVPDVAAELMFSESTVYRHISRALSRLYRPVLEVQPLLEDWRMGALK